GAVGLRFVQCGGHRCFERGDGGINLRFARCERGVKAGAKIGNGFIHCGASRSYRGLYRGFERRNRGLLSVGRRKSVQFGVLVIAFRDLFGATGGKLPVMVVLAIADAGCPFRAAIRKILFAGIYSAEQFR
ncbi:MAG: hypothetical protein RL681_538, partial [Candidatus Parcubacteria bacterium]